jgi:hypothetical protein
VGDPDILGKLITLDGAGYTVIGIMPLKFEFNHRRCEFWVPPSRESLETSQKRDWYAFKVYARAKAGITPGLAGALAATRLMSNLLFEVKATDPATYLFVSLLLLLWSLGAIYLPARRATQVDPLTALRYE